jgi:hypothetical protein
MDPEILSKAQRRAHKLQRKFEKEQGKLKKFSPPTSANHSNTTILCVRFGQKYSLAYVEKLRNMIQRNITVPYKMVCLTDDPTPIDGIELIVQRHAGYTKGWWHKVHMFDTSLPLSGRILYMDLDVVICSNIDRLTQIYGSDFMGIRDFNRKFHRDWKYLNSSVMSWMHGSQNHIYEDFMKNPQAAMRMHGDQDWTWKCAKNKIKFWPESWIQSYKWEIRNRNELQVIHGVRQFTSVKDDVSVPNDCSILVFHGDPNPAIVQDKLVVDNWK